MARLARLYAPGVTQLAFAAFSDAVKESLLSDSKVFDSVYGWLITATRRYGVALHGWRIDSSGITIVATPSQALSVGQTIQMIGRHLAAQFASGSVFSGRYRSCLVQNGRWVLPSLLWVDSQNMSITPSSSLEVWPWCSARAHIGAHPATGLSPHPDYWACGNTPFDRQAVYRERLMEGISATQTERIQAALIGQWALGDDEFVSQLDGLTSRRPAALRRGRPKKSAITVQTSSSSQER